MKFIKTIALMMSMLSITAGLCACNGTVDPADTTEPVTDSVTTDAATTEPDDSGEKEKGYYGLEFERPVIVAAYGGNGSA